MFAIPALPVASVLPLPSLFFTIWEACLVTSCSIEAAEGCCSLQGCSRQS